MTESQEVDEGLESEKYKHKKSFKFLKMKIINGGSKQELFTSQVGKNIEKNATIISDRSTSCVGLKENDEHQSRAKPQCKLPP